MRRLSWLVVASLCACAPAGKNQPPHIPPQKDRTPPAKAAISEDYTKHLLGSTVLLEAEKDGFLSVLDVKYSPSGNYFLAIACGYECNDNIGFLFESDGSAKQKITARWDFILQSRVEWSADGKHLYYYRINSTGADPPADAPPSGWVQVAAQSGAKSPATTRTLKTTANYSIFNVQPDDVLNVRAAAGATAAIVGTLSPTAKGIRVTGSGIAQGGSTWVPIRYQNLSGWVNQNYLCEE